MTVSLHVLPAILLSSNAKPDAKIRDSGYLMIHEIL
jgi:hypothetical protein